MANKRMFSKAIIDSDPFLDMPLSTQALYFHANMRADDEGFVDNIKKIMRMIGSNQNDFDLLTAKRYFLVFESGVVVIKHWKVHNTLRKDRFSETLYKEEKGLIFEKDNGAYTLAKPKVTELSENGQPYDNQMTTTWQPSIDKIRLDKIRLDKIRLDKIRLRKIVVSDNPTSEIIIIEESKTKYPKDSKPYLGVEYLINRMIEDNEFAKVPKVGSKLFDTWCNNLNILHNRGYDWDTIANVLKWCKDDTFWNSNILSTGKFKEKFEKLLGASKIKYTQGKKGTNQQIKESCESGAINTFLTEV